MTRDQLEHCKKTAEKSNSSPYYKALGIEITYLREGHSRATIVAQEQHYHPGRVMHGGAIASLLDSAGAMAGMSVLDPRDELTTADLKINFISPVKAGETLIAEGRVAHKGRTLVLVEMEARTDDGRLVAKGLTTCVILKRQSSWVKHQ